MAFTVSGTISLPAGVVAPNGGVEIELRGLFLEFSNPNDEQIVTIPFGQSSANYFLEFDGSRDQSIQFECLADCSNLGVTNSGSWSDIDGVVTSISGTEYSAVSDHVVNIVLENATVFSGQVLFPEGFVAQGGEFVIVTVSSQDFLSFSFFSESGSLDAGQTTFSFNLAPPTDGTSSTWVIDAECFVGCDEEIVFIDTDNFASTINGDPTTLDEDEAFEFSPNGSFTDLNLTLQGPNPPEPPTNPPAPPVDPGDESVIAPVLQLLLLDDD